MAESRMGEEEGHGNLTLEMTKEVRKNVNVTETLKSNFSNGGNLVIKPNLWRKPDSQTLALEETLFSNFSIQ